MGTRQKIQQSLNFGSANEFPESYEDSSPKESREDRKKRKQKKEKDMEEGNKSNNYADDLGDGMPPLNSRLPLDVKKPTSVAVDEVRNALGVGSSLPPVARGHTPGGGLGIGRLPDYDGGGLSSAGRAKVKPGLRLEPIEHLD